MHITIEITMPSKRVRDAFYRRYGRAMAGWAQVESALARWFIYACDAQGEQRAKMRKMFYSARSFNGSSDMLKAAFFGGKRQEALSEFFTSAINKTMGYYAFRNRLAHFLPVYYHNIGRYVLTDGGQSFIRQDFIGERDLIIAATNFSRLTRIWLNACPSRQPKPLLTPQEALQRIEALPGEAHSRVLSRKQRGRQRQRQARQESRG